MVSISDWISIICSGVALIVTIIIAVMRLKKTKMRKQRKRWITFLVQRHEIEEVELWDENV